MQRGNQKPKRSSIQHNLDTQHAGLGMAQWQVICPSTYEAVGQIPSTTTKKEKKENFVCTHREIQENLIERERGKHESGLNTECAPLSTHNPPAERECLTGSKTQAQTTTSHFTTLNHAITGTSPRKSNQKNENMKFQKAWKTHQQQHMVRDRFYS